MGEIVNLNRARKRRVREREALDAQENRVRFGRSSGEKCNDRQAVAKREAVLDGKQRLGFPEGVISDDPPRQ